MLKTILEIKVVDQVKVSAAPKDWWWMEFSPLGRWSPVVFPGLTPRPSSD